MGAPGWIIDAPNTGYDIRPNPTSIPWTDEERAAAASAVKTYETKIRPLVRNGDLYHIFPRPDGIVWDGIEYYDRETHKGVVYIFKPESPEDTHNIVLKGLDPDLTYHLSFEDGSNAALSMLGSELMSAGVNVTLYGRNVSELMFIETPEPDTLTIALGAAMLILCKYSGSLRRVGQAFRGEDSSIAMNGFRVEP